MAPVIAAVACLVACLAAMPSLAHASSTAPAPTGRVVLIGVPGLRWHDLDPDRTPNLWGLAARAAVGSLSTRTVPPEGRSITCPMSGWLTLSAGRRSGAPGPGCALPPAPDVAGDGSAMIPGWAALAAFQRSGPYRAQIGLLGQTIIEAGGRVAAIGPGAALAAADPTGKVQKYAANVDGLPDLTSYTVVFAEADDIVRAWLSHGGMAELPDEVRRGAVAAADRTVGALLARVPPGSTVLVAGLSDSGPTAHLHVAIAGTGGPYRPGLLTAASTRQHGLVTLTDLTATVTHLLGIQTPAGAVGRPWQSAPDASGDATVARLADADLAGQVLARVREPFYIALVAGQLLFYGLAAAVLSRRRMLPAVQAVAVISGAIPVSMFLAQLVPWWSFGHPMPMLIGTILGIAGLIAALAFAGPWRGHVLGPTTVVAGVSSLALLADVVTGSRLQVYAVSGYEPVTGGRFYGFGNMAFAVFSTGTILLLAGVAQALTGRFRSGRRAAVATCLAYGLLAIFADGWPGWGADFGGVPSFAFGMAVFLLTLTGRRVSVARLGIAAAAGLGLIGLIAVADWSRPADRRTHLGAFLQQVLDGEGGPVVGRKLGAMLHTLGNLPLTLLALAAVAFLFLVLSRPSRWGASALSLAYDRASALRAGLLGVLTAAVTGLLINDSGIAIPAMALTVAVPLSLAASVRALRLAPPSTAARSSARSEATAPPAP